MQENFITLIKQFSDIFEYNNNNSNNSNTNDNYDDNEDNEDDGKLICNGKENLKFDTEIASKLSFLNLNLNFQDEFFKLLEETAENTNTPEDDTNSCNNNQDKSKNKKSCYDKYSINTSSKSKSFKGLSLNIIGLSNLFEILMLVSWLVNHY